MSRQLKFIVGAVLGVLVLSLLVVMFVIKGPSSSKNQTSTGNTVRIEVRAIPQMTIKKDGKNIGKTPVSFVVSRSTARIALDAEWVDQRIYAKREELVPRHAHKDIVPDHDQTIDFIRRDGDPVKEDRE